jgi:hypothetical protein
MRSRGLLDQQSGPQQQLLPQQRKQQQQQAADEPAPHATASAAQQPATAAAGAAAAAAMQPMPAPEGGTAGGTGTVPDIGCSAGGSFVAPTALTAYLDNQVCDALQR